MIKSIHLENFESHKDTFLEFPPGLTVFVGESDRGKSGVFRGYYWNTENNPGGEWMLPLYWKYKEAVVTTEFINPDVVVKRIRSKSKNLYQLNEEEPINAGTSVPEKIKELINVDSVNFQSQIERAFLMFETAGERGRILNRIAGLDKIEFTLSNATQDVNSLTGLWKAEKETIKSKIEELEQFSDLSDMEERVEKLSFLQSLEIRSKLKLNTLNRVKYKLKEIEEIRSQISIILPAEEALLDLKSKQEEKERLLLKIDKLKKLLYKVKDVEVKEGIEQFNGIQVKFNSLEEKKKTKLQIQKKISSLLQLKEDYVSVGIDIEGVEEEIKTIQSKLPNICFECGREL